MWMGVGMRTCIHRCAMCGAVPHSVLTVIKCLRRSPLGSSSITIITFTIPQECTITCKQVSYWFIMGVYTRHTPIVWALAMFEFVSTHGWRDGSVHCTPSKNQAMRFWYTPSQSCPPPAKTPIHHVSFSLRRLCVYTIHAESPAASPYQPQYSLLYPSDNIDAWCHISGWSHTAVNTVYTDPPLWCHASLLHDSCMAIDPGGIEGLQLDMACLKSKRKKLNGCDLEPHFVGTYHWFTHNWRGKGQNSCSDF